jgi:RNA polymerase sigma-70 factor (ECF subfamily)
MIVDEGSFYAAFRDHSRAVHRTAWEVLRDDGLADDVVQEVFLGLWRRPERFDPRRGDLRTFLQVHARGRALDAWRAAEARRRAQERLVDTTLSQRPAPDAASVVAEREQRADVLRAIHALPSGQRDAAVLTCLGYSAGEVATVTQIPLGTAKSRVRLGLAKVRRELDGLTAQPAAA